MNISGFPVYEALITDEFDGMLRISLVDAPAVEKDFLAFGEASRRPQRFAVQDEDRRIVRGVVMRADYPIYRRDGDFEYYIVYSADTIRRMAERYLLDNRQNRVDLRHDGEEVKGVQMVQYFLKDTAAGIAPAGFDDVADGSLFAEFHVTNDAIWAEIKAGTYKGFSLEGLFDLRPAGEKAPSIEETIPNYKKMSKISKLKALLAKALVELANVTTDKGILEWDTEEDLKAGDEVFVVNQDGEREAAPEGDYVTEDGKTIRVAEGKVVEIVDPEAEVSEDEAVVEFASKSTDKGELFWEGEDDLKAGDEVFVEADGERVPAPDGEYVTEDGKVIVVVEGKVAEIRDAEAEVAPEPEEGPSEVEELRAQVARLQKQVAVLKARPLAKSAHEEVSEAGKPASTGNKGLDRIARLMSAK